MNRRFHIGLAVASPIISEGLKGILNGQGPLFQLSVAGTPDDISRFHSISAFDVVLMDPSFINSNARTFHALKNQLPAVRWVGIIYTLCHPDMLSQFDGIVSIYDSPQTIHHTIKTLLSGSRHLPTQTTHDILSERETDVLKLLATGLANKEIADKLNISINTVITHRKNISQKTGIRSVSGLTIFAVTQKLITI
jgi:DNA-binding NarL/FixJ family response regulator